MPVSRPRRFFGFFLIAQKETRRPQTAKYPENKTEISPCGASDFPNDGKVTKGSPGDVAFWKDLRLTPWSFRSHFPPDPPILRGRISETPAATISFSEVYPRPP